MPITVQSVPVVPTEVTPNNRSGIVSQVEKTFSGTDRTFPTFSNLVGHYDSSYINGMNGTQPSNEDALAQWSDISGNNNHLLQATAAYKPKFLTSSRNLVTYNQATAETNTTGMSLTGTNCTLTRSTTSPKTGTASFAITTSEAGNFNCGTAGGTSGTPVNPNTQYTATFSGKWATTGRNMTVEVLAYNESGVFQTAYSTSATVGSTSAWTQKSVTFTTPSNVYFVSIKAWGYSAAAAGEIMYVDEFGLWEGTSTTWTEPTKFPSVKRPVVQCGTLGNMRAAPGTAAWDFTAGPTATMSAYVVAMPDADPNTYASLVHTNGWSSNNDGFFIRHRSNGYVEGVHASGVVSTTHLSASGGTGPTTGNWHVYSITINAATPLLKVTCDGVVFTDKTPSTTPKGPPYGLYPLNIGTFAANPPSTLMQALSYAEIMIFSVEHNDATRQAIERSLGSKYGITVA